MEVAECFGQDEGGGEATKIGSPRRRGSTQAQAGEERQETQETGRETSDLGSRQREEPGRSEVCVVLGRMCLLEFIFMASPPIS